MPFDRIDRSRLKCDLFATATQCYELKQALRRRWTRPMADEQRALARLARRMTELCILRARLRGRWHLGVAPHPVRQAGAAWDQAEYHTRIAERVALDYALDDGGPPGKPRAAVESGAPAS